jgi:hypothetical protein
MAAVAAMTGLLAWLLDPAIAMCFWKNSARWCC